MNYLSKKTSETRIYGERKVEKPGKRVFFDVHLKTNGLVYLKTCKSNKDSLAIFIRK